jgi:hypothetical protein
LAGQDPKLKGRGRQAALLQHHFQIGFGHFLITAIFCRRKKAYHRKTLGPNFEE